MRSSFLASVDVTEFHTTEAYSSLGLRSVKYNNNNKNKQSRVEKECVIISPNALREWDKI
jgi:hypothetical protein